MMRRPMAVRRGPGLVGTMARTAVVAGTATAVVGSVSRHQQNKANQQQAAAEAQQQQAADQQQLADVQAQMNALQAQQAQAAAATASGVPPAPAPDMTTQLQNLASLRTQGLLTDAEFEAAKAKLLA